MAGIIVPTITAFSESEYNNQVKQLAPFAQRVHIDLMDGEFAPTVSPKLDTIWWPHQFEMVDIHLMYQRPMDYIEQLILLKPHMVIVHVEATVHHMHFAAELHKEGINVGLSILADTPIENVEQIINSFDHLLIFSGNLGHFGGKVNTELFSKITQAKLHHPNLEIGWDGGINAENAAMLRNAGVDVLNVGGYIQKADDPHAAFNQLQTVIAD